MNLSTTGDAGDTDRKALYGSRLPSSVSSVVER
jgi:hypothetical protein